MKDFFGKNAAHALYVALMFSGMALSFVKWIVFARVLLPADFGVYSAVMSSIAIGAYVGGMGLNEYLIQRGSSNHGQGKILEIYRLRDRSVVVGLAVTMLTLAPVCIVSYTMKWWGLEVEHFALVCAVLASTVVFGIVDASFRAAQRTLAFAGMVFLRAVLLLVLGYSLANQSGIFGIFLAELASAVTAIAVALWIWGPNPRIKDLKLNLMVFKRLLFNGFSFLKLQLLRYGSVTLDKLIVGWFLGALALGQYSFLLITFLAFTAFAGVYNAAIIPRLISIFNKNNDSNGLARTTCIQAFTFLAGSAMLGPMYLWVLGEVISRYFGGYFFQTQSISAACIYTGAALHVATQFFDSYFYALKRQAELTLVAALSLLLFTAYYLLVGSLQTPTVLLFSLAFLLSKISWFLITFYRVVQINKMLPRVF